MTKKTGRRHGHDHGHEHEHEHNHGHDHGHGPYDRHRNPEDFERYRARLEDPGREAWQKPDALVTALGLEPGDVACDVGAGTGYLALRLARAVGSAGAVYAIDVEPRMIEALSARIRETGIGNVHPILARPGRPALPPRRCRVILVVNTFHHFSDGAAYLRRLAGRLAPGGRIVVVDFHRRELPVGPPPGHRLARQEVVAAARRAGLDLARERRFLPYQYFLELAPVRAGSRRPPARKPEPVAKAASRPRTRRAPAARRRAPRSTR